MADNIKTLSAEIDEKSRNQHIRHSLQPKSNQPEAGVNIRRHSSMGRGRNQNNLKKPSVPDILEVEKSDDDASDNLQPGAMKNSVSNERISFTKKTRKTSNISRTSSKNSLQNGPSVEKGYINYGYDQSTRSSLHGSVASLPVMREQYCCCQRWTRLERNLAIIVALLALVIVGLIITIGLVANHNERSDTMKLNFKF